MRDFSIETRPTTPQEEDGALFASPLGQCQVVLIPSFRTSRQHEQVIHGFLQGNSEVEVLFSGRRRPLAEPLISRLSHMWEQAEARASRRAPADPHRVRLPVAVYGAWRARFTTDDDGWQTKRYQLIAAIWRMHDASGRPITRGSAPLLGRVHRSRVT
jgi:hypothetical protein